MYDETMNIVESNQNIKETLPDVFPELIKIIRKLLPQEIPLNLHVRNVDYTESTFDKLSGTLYLTTFRLVFAPDNAVVTSTTDFSSGNKFIGEYDIPLTSIYKINVAPVDSRTGFKSFLNEDQIKSETRSFTIITRDFRMVTFTKCLVIKSNSHASQQLPVTKMETYIDALKFSSKYQEKEQLYPYLALSRSTIDMGKRYDVSNLRHNSWVKRSISDEDSDFRFSEDERIKSYLMYSDWKSELDNANEEQWVVDREKFDERNIAIEDGPFVRLNRKEGTRGLIWHWTHTSLPSENNYRKQRMLVTVPDIPPESEGRDPLRRITTDSRLTTLNYSSHHYHHPSSDATQEFQRYNLSKFPCNLKRLQASYEKLLEICLIPAEDQDEKWLSKLNVCKWLKYVSNALHGAALLAKVLDYKHIELAGSDYDNSCLMSSLIQILLRPKCRTIKGFCELIVKEWITRGHHFRERFGYDNTSQSAQESPLFLLFLDCVYQLIVQNPFLFEFTDDLLIELYRSVCYCYHHTFVFNNVNERLDAMNNCPPHVLLLSTFDFSLYLYSNICRSLRNEASIFSSSLLPSTSTEVTVPYMTPTLRYPQSASTTYTPNRHHRQSLSYTNNIEQTVPGVNRHNYKSVYFEAPLGPSQHVTSTPVSEKPSMINDYSLSLAVTLRAPTVDALNEASLLDFENIESPQIFLNDLIVDWRLFNIVFWTKCYCRYEIFRLKQYDENSVQEQLSDELHFLHKQLKVEKMNYKRIQSSIVNSSSHIRNKSNREKSTLDIYYPFSYANSWHPNTLDTRV